MGNARAPGDFEIVEQGAHGGEFAHDVLSAARADHPDFFAALHYRIVEPFPILQQRQAAQLQDFTGKVSWHPSLAAMPPFCGVHFSNELLDAFPVHLIRWDGTAWSERHVTIDGDTFTFLDQPVSDPQLIQHLRLLPQSLPAGYETEANLAALDWIETVANKLTSGYILTVDYGWPRAEFYSPHRTTGTLRGYKDHRTLASPLTHVGHADLTAHVDWTTLAERATAHGLALLGFTDQHHFLTGLLANERGENLLATAHAKTKRELQTLLHPQHLGMKFQYLCLTKNLSPRGTLSGLRFARDPAAALDFASQ